MKCFSNYEPKPINLVHHGQHFKRWNTVKRQESAIS